MYTQEAAYTNTNLPTSTRVVKFQTSPRLILSSTTTLGTSYNIKNKTPEIRDTDNNLTVKVKGFFYNLRLLKMKDFQFSNIVYNARKCVTNHLKIKSIQVKTKFDFLTCPKPIYKI
jgi:hypothetical protein